MLLSPMAVPEGLQEEEEVGAPSSPLISPKFLMLAPFSLAQVSAVCQHVCCLPPRGEGALRLVPRLQPRWPPPAHHEVAGDQLALPRWLRPPLRVHLSPLPAGADGQPPARSSLLYLLLCK